MEKVREVVRREAKNQSRDERGRLAAVQLADESMHRQRARHERCDQQDVVAEHEIVRDGVNRRDEERLQQQMIRVRERQRRRKEDRCVEHAAVHKPAGMRRQRSKIPAERPEIQRRIACRIDRPEQAPKVQNEWPRERARGDEIHDGRYCCRSAHARIMCQLQI